MLTQLQFYPEGDEPKRSKGQFRQLFQPFVSLFLCCSTAFSSLKGQGAFHPSRRFWARRFASSNRLVVPSAGSASADFVSTGGAA